MVYDLEVALQLGQVSGTYDYVAISDLIRSSSPNTGDTVGLQRYDQYEPIFGYPWLMMDHVQVLHPLLSVAVNLAQVQSCGDLLK